MACFETLKDEITAVSSLQYYDPTILVSLEVDASQKGLGSLKVKCLALYMVFNDSILTFTDMSLKLLLTTNHL